VESAGAKVRRESPLLPDLVNAARIYTPTVAFRHDHSADQWARHLSVDGADVDYSDQAA
jgi:hypothetical protein